jgi:hypothetical protein
VQLQTLAESLDVVIAQELGHLRERLVAHCELHLVGMFRASTCTSANATSRLAGLTSPSSRFSLTLVPSGATP